MWLGGVDFFVGSRTCPAGSRHDNSNENNIRRAVGGYFHGRSTPMTSHDDDFRVRPGWVRDGDARSFIGQVERAVRKAAQGARGFGARRAGGGARFGRGRSAAHSRGLRAAGAGLRRQAQPATRRPRPLNHRRRRPNHRERRNLARPRSDRREPGMRPGRSSRSTNDKMGTGTLPIPKELEAMPDRA